MTYCDTSVLTPYCEDPKCEKCHKAKISMKETKEEKLNYKSPILINEDIWFYPNKRSFDFVIWAKIGDKKQVVRFRLTHRKIKKYIEAK